MSFKNAVKPDINNASDLMENEAKIKFMKFKNQNVLFFNRVPHFDCDSPIKEKGNKYYNADNCPTKRLNFFENAKTSFNQRKKFNSYLFQNK